MKTEEIINQLKNPSLAYKVHPWHGVHIGDKAPHTVNCFIEMVPSDAVKYEIDKDSGYLQIDRPQKFSNIMPALYGFIPQTYCDTRVAKYSSEKAGLGDLAGDKDPLDICVLTEREVSHGDLMVEAIPIGGFRMIDDNEADDKIIAVLKQDAFYGSWKDIRECPESIINRLKHYFLTYKDLPGHTKSTCEITHVYGREEALEVIRLSSEDYKSSFHK